MTINEKLMELLSPVECPVWANIFREDVPEYMTFDYTADPQELGDNTYGAFSYTVSLHYFFQASENPFAKVRAVLELLQGDDTFLLTRIENTADLSVQYYLFTLTCVGGPVYGEL